MNSIVGFPYLTAGLFAVFMYLHELFSELVPNGLPSWQDGRVSFVLGGLAASVLMGIVMVTLSLHVALPMSALQVYLLSKIARES